MAEPSATQSNAMTIVPGELLTSEPHNWYAIQTRYRFEAKVAANLQRKCVEIFLPTLQEVYSPLHQHGCTCCRQKASLALSGFGATPAPSQKNRSKIFSNYSRKESHVPCMPF